MMADLTPTMNDAYHEYAGLLLRRHRLLEDSKDESPETEAVEERLTALWAGFDETQRQSLNGIASDLNWVRRHGQPAPKARRPEEVTGSEEKQLQRAEKGGDWHTALHLLRVCAPKLDDAAELARRRARALNGTGLKDLAGVFEELAEDLPSEIPDRAIKEHARSFAETAGFLYKHIPHHNVQSILLEGAFALELYLKALNSFVRYHPLEHSGFQLTSEAAQHVHDLVELYDSIAEPVREVLASAYAASPPIHPEPTLREALDRFRNVFKEIRYVYAIKNYEGKGITDLIRLLEFVKRHVESMPARPASKAS